MKWVTVVSILLCLSGSDAAAPAVSSREVECLAGSEWESNCHSCRCSASGVAECVRLDGCNLKPYREPIKCKPSTSFQVDCNTCICGENGSTFCTAKGCLGDVRPEWKDRRTRAVSSREVECLAGSEWESNCHSCRCSASGVAECVRQDDCDLKHYREPIRCKPSTSFKIDCNTCRCDEDGSVSCTLMGCLGNVRPGWMDRRTRAVSSREVECLAGSEWESNCHSCRCSASGVAECVRQDDCDLKHYREPIRCKPSTSFKIDCNTCRCEKNGLVSCTLMGCLGNVRPGWMIRRKRQAPALLKTCKPGTRWNESCNSCWCTDAGISVCTKIGCVEKPKRQAPAPVKTCEPGTFWMERCNSCRCTLDGYPACTKMKCVEIPKEKVQKRDIPEESSKSLHAIKKRGVCKPDQESQIDCNPCKCAVNGQSYSCTHSECLEGDTTNKEVEVFIESEGSDHIERHSVCKPRDIFYAGCNICHCNQYGTDYSCTNKPCPLPKDVEIFHELKVAKTQSSNNTKRVICVANRMFILDCNTCWCNEDGTSFYCTRRICTPESPEEISKEDSDETKLRVIKQECRPNEVFELDCNMCRCNADGTSFSCTRRACVDVDDKKGTLTRHTRALQEAPKACQPGTEFRLDCNKCLCDDEGQDYSCTRIDCAAQNGNGGVDTFGSTRSKRELTETIIIQCVPGAVFHRNCNVCHCTEDGQRAVCTMKRCKKDGTDRDTTTEPAPSFRCTPGDQFKRDCNDCTCSADGKNVFCTIRLCDEELNDMTDVGQ